MTVNILIQVDKLVQLIESPVFTCMLLGFSAVYQATNLSPRSSAPTLGTGKVPILIQVYVRNFNVTTAVICLRCFEESTQQREFDRISTCGSTQVCARRRILDTICDASVLIPCNCSATASSSSTSSYDRPNRLKGREDVSIRWVELLEKFRSVQERARRAQRLNTDLEDGPPWGLGELRFTDGASEVKPKETRGPTPVAPPQKDTSAQPPVPPKKSGLGRQFGRLGGAVSGKSKRS